MKLKARRKDPSNSTSEAKQHKGTSPLMYGLYIGFFAGLIWGGIKLIEFALRFTELSPGFMLEPLLSHSFLISRIGLVVGYAAFIVFSIIAAIIYAMLLRKMVGPVPGLAYGLLWWALIYLVIGPLVNITKPFKHLDLNTFVTDLSLFLLWGLFIGYSIAMEFTDERSRKSYEQGLV